MAKREDEELVEKAREGSAEALQQLLERHQGRIYRFGMKMCGDPRDAEDVVQETLLTVARRIGDFRGEASVSSWLYTIARSFCIKQRRRSKFAPAYEESLDGGAATEVRALPDPGDEPEEEAAAHQRRVVLQRAIDSLPERSREVLVLRDIEGLTAPEVAEVVGMSVEAVKSRLHRARLQLREQLMPLLAEPGESVPLPPPDCPDVLTAYSQKLEDEITPDLCAELERHLEGCAHCRGACETLRQSVSLCRSASTPKVPEALQQSIRRAIRALPRLPL